MYVCVCVCERERERERVCVCVCGVKSGELSYISGLKRVLCLAELELALSRLV